MKSFFTNLIKKMHVCNFNKPIASMYISFHGRDIVYECQCGKRKIEREYRVFNSPFPIETNIGIDSKAMERIAAGEDVYYVIYGVEKINQLS